MEKVWQSGNLIARKFLRRSLLAESFLGFPIISHNSIPNIDILLSLSLFRQLLSHKEVFSVTQVHINRYGFFFFFARKILA